MKKEAQKKLGEREKRLLARWVSNVLPKVVEEMHQDGAKLPPLSPEEPESPRFKFGHQAFDDARAQHQMAHEAYEIASNDNLWLAESAVRCPRCGKVTFGADPSECSGCGLGIPRRNNSASKSITTPPRNIKRVRLLGALGLVSIITLGLFITHYLANNHQTHTAPIVQQKSTKLLGEWRTLRSAIRLIEHFHQAASIDEKASLVKDFPERQNALSTYYSKHAFEPSQVSRIIKTGWHEIDGLASYLIHGAYDSGNEFLAFVCEENGQLALDWQAFTGHNPVPFTEFLDSEIDEPTELRVVAQSISVETFPELAADYRFYKLYDRHQSDSCWALVKKHSEAGKVLASLIAPPKDPSFSLFSTTNEVATASHQTPPRRLILSLRHDDSLGIVIDKVVSTEWLSQTVPADVHYDI